MSDPDPQLRLGPVFNDAMSLFTDEGPATKPYRMYVTGEGTTFGNGEPIVRVIQTFLSDVATSVIDGYDSRDVNLSVWVEADNERDLAQAESDLMAQLYKPNLLWWRGPRSTQPWAVFEVSTSKLVIAAIGEVDYDETMLRRGYTVSLTCGAWVRSKDEEVAEFIANGNPANDVTITAGASLSSPSVVTDGIYDTSTIVLGRIKMVRGSSGHTNSADLFFAIAFAPTAGCVVKVIGQASVPVAASATVRVTATGSRVPAELVATIPNPGDTQTQWYFYVPAGTYNEFRIRWTPETYGPGLPGPFATGTEFYVDNALLTETAPSIGTLRQSFSAFDIEGSVSARGSVEVYDDGMIGDGLIYTFVDDGRGYVPALRRYRDAALSVVTPTSAPSSTSGYLEDLTGALVYAIPVRSLPDGTYDIVGYTTRADPSQDLVHKVQWDARVSFVPDTLVTSVAYLGPFDAVTYDPANYGVGGDADERFRYGVLGQITMPMARLADDTTAYLVLTLNPTVSGPKTAIDEIYLFNIDTGDYTIVEAIDGAGYLEPGRDFSALSVVGPTVEWPAPSIMVGLTDEPDTFYAPAGSFVKAWGRHDLTPGRLSALVVSSSALDASCRVRYYPRGHTNPGS